MEDVNHADIYRRIEKVEVDVAVLDSKTNRLHEDLVDMKADVKMMSATMHENSIIARSVESKMASMPKTIGLFIAIATIIISIMQYVEGGFH